MKRIIRCLPLLVITLVVLLPIFSSSRALAVQAAKTHGGPLVPHVRPHHKPLPRRTSRGVARTHLPALPVSPGVARHAAANARFRKGALVSAATNPATATTLFSDDMENGASGWTTVGDNQRTTYYPNGHNFWNLAQSPNTLSVPHPRINPNLVSLPDPAGKLPSPNSGTHAWWYGDNPAADTQNPAGASMTYMGNQSDWPSPEVDGGLANGPNSGSLISPVIDLTTAPDATLSFASWWEIEGSSPAHFALMYVDVSKDGGNSWTTQGVLNPTTDPAGGTDAIPYSNNGLDVAASWQTVSVNLSAYVGSKVNVRFRFDSVDQYDTAFRGWFIDDVGVYSVLAGTPQLATISPNNASAGTPVTLSGSGFGAQQGTSTVTFNGVAATVQTWSDSSIVTSVPVGATTGPLLVSIAGTPAFSTSFTVNASLTLSAPTSSPKMLDTLIGTGFAPAESVAFYLNGVNGTRLGAATADASGNLPATNITVPNQPAGNYLLLAFGASSHITAGAMLSLVPVLTLSSSTAQPGQTITVTALGFAAQDNVQFQLDSTSASNLATLPCNARGGCSGTVTLPTSNVTAGLHLLVATGTTSALLTESPLTFTPILSANPTSGGPASLISLSGAGFVAKEVVQISWGTISEGATTTDVNGNLSYTFNAPSASPAATYTITATRSGQTPATLTTQFIVSAPTLTATAGILNGQTVQVQLTNFQAGEQVALSWNANGGAQLTTITTSSVGSGYGSFTAPSAPAGSYTLTATGNTSKLQATSSIDVGPGIQINPMNAAPGSSLAVSGGGYAPAEQLSVYIQSTSATGIPTTGVVAATTNATGAFSATLTLPTTYQSGTSYAVYAANAAGTHTASAPFSFTTPTLFIGNYPTYGTQLSLSAQGFLANEAVVLYWNYGQPTQTQAGTATVAVDGTFSVKLNVSSLPAPNGYAALPITAIGSTSKLQAANTTYEYPGIVLTPASAPAGTPVQVKGGTFGPAESVTVSYKGTSMGTVTTDANGAFTFTFTVPASSTLGSVTVQARGATTNASAYATFIVTPIMSITPATGPAGTSIALSGQAYSVSGSVNLYWYDPTTGNSSYLGSATASGTFTATIAAPAGLTPGNTYYVQAYDAATGVFAQSAFVAQ